MLEVFDCLYKFPILQHMFRVISNSLSTTIEKSSTFHPKTPAEHRVMFMNISGEGYYGIALPGNPCNPCWAVVSASVPGRCQLCFLRAVTSKTPPHCFQNCSSITSPLCAVHTISRGVGQHTTDHRRAGLVKYKKKKPSRKWPRKWLYLSSV